MAKLSPDPLAAAAIGDQGGVEPRDERGDGQAAARLPGRQTRGATPELAYELGTAGARPSYGMPGRAEEGARLWEEEEAAPALPSWYIPQASAGAG